MTQPNIKINTDSVRRHASMVDAMSEMISEAAGAGAWVRAGNESYGKLYGPLFTSVLNPKQDDTISAVRYAVSATQTLADLLRATADDLDTSDEHAAQRLGGN